MNLSITLRGSSAALASLGLVAALWAERVAFRAPPVEDADAYHASIRRIAGSIDTELPGWESSTVEPPASAVELLRPNVLWGRLYRNSATGERAVVAVVQCQDARDMRGHWPPVCYPAQGWTLGATSRRRLEIGDVSVPVAVYSFTVQSSDRYEEATVYSFFVRPDGTVEDGGVGIRALSDDPRLRIFGAAHIQVAYDQPMASARSDEIFVTLVRRVLPLIDAVRGGSR